MNTLFAPMERRFDADRRTFLKVGVAGAALLLVGRWLPPARAGWASAGQALAFANISPADAVALGRIIPVMLHGALPQDEAERQAAIGEIIYGVDITIGYQPPAVRREIRDLFGLLTKRVTRVVVAGVWKPWDRASNEEIQKFLIGWRNSRFGLLRSAYVGLHDLTIGSWYANPRSWARIGYGGPPKIA
jgi:hypothetical protein